MTDKIAPHFTLTSLWLLLLACFLVALGAFVCIWLCLKANSEVQDDDDRDGDGGGAELGGRAGRAAGLPQECIKQVPASSYCTAAHSAGAPDDEVCCSICLSCFKDKERVRVLPDCGHCFHVDCIDVWLASHASCPVCRRHLLIVVAR